jgi:hypothetical protein
MNNTITRENQRNYPLKDRIAFCKANVKEGDEVKVFQNGTFVKRGKVIEITTTGLKIFNPKDEYDVLPQNAEWFAFENKIEGEPGGVVLVGEVE